MPEEQEPVSREVFYNAFSNMNDRIKSLHDEMKETLSRIEAQTTRTNGRVTKLELWRSLLIGGSIIIFACGAAFAKLYIQAISRQTAHEVVDTINKTYNVEVHD